ncbi:MAG: T9SS type A sorting domain-containing protein, partial [Bacteroidota bacterium]
MFNISNIQVYDSTLNQPSSFNDLSIINSSTKLIYYVPVWPGDLNNDRVVNVADILPIGYFYNATGPARPNGNLTWTAQPSPLWGFDKEFIYSDAYKTFADGNADGTIQLGDQVAIASHLGQIHLRTANEFAGFPEQKVSTGNPPLWIDITTDTINTISLPYAVTAPIHLGTSSDPVNNLYGIAFDIFFDPNCVNISTITITPTNFFGILSADYIKILDNSNPAVSQGRISIGITRINSIPLNASGDIICNLSCTVVNAICAGGWFKLMPHVLSCNEINGMPIPLDEQADSAQLTGVGVGINVYQTTNEYEIYPNPTNGTVTLKFNSKENQNCSLILTDITGRELMREQLTATEGKNEHTIDVSSLVNGVYLIKLKTIDGKIVKRIIKE